MRKFLNLNLDYFLRMRNEIEEEASQLSAESGHSLPETPIKVVPVTKYLERENARLLLDHDQTPLGENRAQELEQKTDPGQDPGSWHFIGKLQRNKISVVAPRVDLIHSVDSQRLAESLDRWTEDHLNRKLAILVQVNIAGEKQKSGLDPLEALESVPDWIDRFQNLQFQGLMTMAPNIAAEECRPVFRSLRKLRDDIRQRVPDEASNFFFHLSMGMSADWRVAASEGATLLRIGRSLFPKEADD